MRKRKTSFKNKAISIVSTSILAQILVLVGLDLVSTNLYIQLVNHYSNILFIEPEKIYITISYITDPIRDLISSLNKNI